MEEKEIIVRLETFVSKIIFIHVEDSSYEKLPEKITDYPPFDSEGSSELIKFIKEEAMSIYQRWKEFVNNPSSKGIDRRNLFFLYYYLIDKQKIDIPDFDDNDDEINKWIYNNPKYGDLSQYTDSVRDFFGYPGLDIEEPPQMSSVISFISEDSSSIKKKLNKIMLNLFFKNYIPIKLYL